MVQWLPGNGEMNIWFEKAGSLRSNNYIKHERRESKIRRAAEYFLRTSRCLEM